MIKFYFVTNNKQKFLKSSENVSSSIFLEHFWRVNFSETQDA